MKKSQVFIYSFFLSMPLWWGINAFGIGMDNYFMDREIVKNPYILKAQISSFVSLPKAPEKLEISAKSAFSALIKPNGEEEVVFSKNSEEKLPIASLSKLMSAYIVLNYLDLAEEITVSSDSILINGENNGFTAGQTFKTKDILFSSMTESSNTGINILTQPLGKSAFIDLMNMEAKKIGLANTYFLNPTGVDFSDSHESINYSTAKDIEKLGRKIFENPLASEMLSFKEFDLYMADKTFHHKSVTTNSILSSDFAGLKVIGGKTGETMSAKGCLLLVLKNQKGELLINVILGADDRFGEMKKLVEWSNSMANYKRVLSTLNQ